MPHQFLYPILSLLLLLPFFLKAATTLLTRLSILPKRLPSKSTREARDGDGGSRFSSLLPWKARGGGEQDWFATRREVGGTHPLLLA